MRKPAIITAAALALAALAGGWTLRASEPPASGPAWHETRWPFPMDQWGKGHAFVCPATACGAELTIYLRAKIGFCNCSGGLADDSELDRIGDLELFGQDFAPREAGRAVRVAWMPGRSRLFVASDGRTLLTVGFHDRCDAMVATAVFGSSPPESAAARIGEFLNSRTVADWAERTLGL